MAQMLAPISTNMFLNYVAEREQGLPRSYSFRVSAKVPITK